MTLHLAATSSRALSAHRRGRVGAVGVVVGLALAVAAIAGVGVAATGATLGGAPYLGPSSWQVAGGLTP